MSLSQPPKKKASTSATKSLSSSPSVYQYHKQLIAQAMSNYSQSQWVQAVGVSFGQGQSISGMQILTNGTVAPKKDGLEIPDRPSHPKERCELDCPFDNCFARVLPPEERQEQPQQGSSGQNGGQPDPNQQQQNQQSQSQSQSQEQSESDGNDSQNQNDGSQGQGQQDQSDNSDSDQQDQEQDQQESDQEKQDKEEERKKQEELRKKWDEYEQKQKKQQPQPQQPQQPQEQEQDHHKLPKSAPKQRPARKASLSRHSKDYYTGDVDEIMKDQTFVARLRSVLTDNDFDRRVKGRKRGQLDMRSLHKVPMKAENIFTLKQARKNKDYNVVLLVDQSGSMSGGTDLAQLRQYEASYGIKTRITHAADTASFLVGALSDVGIECAVVGYDGRFRVYKDLDKPLSTKDLKKMHNKLIAQGGGGTDLSPALFKVFDMLKKQKAKAPHSKNIVISLSDGEPNNPALCRTLIRNGARVADYVDITIDDRPLTAKGIRVENAEQVKPLIIRHLKRQVIRG